MTDNAIDLAASYNKPSLVDRILSPFAWAGALAWAMPTTTAMTVLQTLTRPDRNNWACHLYTRLQLTALGCRWRAVVDPAVDPKGIYMFAQTHVNHFDNVVLYPATPHFKQGLENEDHFRYPFYGWFMKSRGTIPVKRGQKGQTGEVLAHMRREVEQGHSLITFPEGTRTRTGRVGPFRKGVFFMARDLGIPIVPVSVVGMYEVMNPHSWVIRPGGDVTVYCDAPIETAGIPDEGIEDLANRVRAVMAARVDAYWDAKAKESGK